MKPPVAYIRRSSANDDNPGDVSRDVQEAAVRDLAHRDGHNGNLVIFDDWNRSADEAKEAKREAFTAMLAEIEAGRVSVVYAYALDRLYRSMRTFVRLTDAAKANGVRIVTLREGVLGGDGSPMAQAFAQITAVFSQLELNTAKARAQGAMQQRRVRGDVFGFAPYGYVNAKVDGRVVRVPDPARPLAPLLDAMRQERSVLAACRRLMDDGVPPPLGPLKKDGTRRQRSKADAPPRWHTRTLTEIIEREAPELLPRRSAVGRRQPARAMFAQLLTCQCGTILTPNGGNDRAQSYYCGRGHVLGSKRHGPLVVQERAVLPFVQDEYARLRMPEEVVAQEDIEQRRQALTDRLERASEMYVMGPPVGWTKERYEREKEECQRALDALDDVATVIETPYIDWTWPPEAINVALRSVFVDIRLGADMRPVKATWRVPEWRAS